MARKPSRGHSFTRAARSEAAFDKLVKNAEVLALCTSSLLWAGVPQALSPPLTLTVGLVAVLHIVGGFAYFVLKSKYVK